MPDPSGDWGPDHSKLSCDILLSRVLRSQGGKAQCLALPACVENMDYEDDATAGQGVESGFAQALWG